MRQGPESRADVEESPSRVPEWPLSSCLQCVWSGCCHAEESLHVVDLCVLLDCFLQMAKLLTIAFSSDGRVPLMQFIMDNPLHISPDAAPSADCYSCQTYLA
jgi:hypothetical protein